jgi:hypothetical protein
VRTTTRYRCVPTPRYGCVLARGTDAYSPPIQAHTRTRHGRVPTPDTGAYSRTNTRYGCVPTPDTGAHTHTTRARTTTRYGYTHAPVTDAYARTALMRTTTRYGYTHAPDTDAYTHTARARTNTPIQARTRTRHGCVPPPDTDAAGERAGYGAAYMQGGRHSLVRSRTVELCEGDIHGEDNCELFLGAWNRTRCGKQDF